LSKLQKFTALKPQKNHGIDKKRFCPPENIIAENGIGRTFKSTKIPESHPSQKFYREFYLVENSVEIVEKSIFHRD